MSSGPHSAGSQRADFEALYERHSREVWALAYARWMNADTAMDVTQEAFLRLWKQWEDGEAILNPRAWLLRVARNLAEDHAKSAFRRNGTHPPQTMNGVQGQEPMPLDSLEREETFSQLRELSGKTRREEIARMLGGQSEEAMRLAATMLGEKIGEGVGRHPR